MRDVDGRAFRDGRVSETFMCDECGAIAATLHFLPPFVAVPTLEPEDALAGTDRVTEEWYRIAIEGGPVGVTITIGEGREGEVGDAVRNRDIPRLRRVSAEFAPFWCSACEKSYCGDHWRTETIWDEGFFDYIEGHCPQNHRQLLLD